MYVSDTVYECVYVSIVLVRRAGWRAMTSMLCEQCRIIVRGKVFEEFRLEFSFVLVVSQF